MSRRKRRSARNIAASGAGNSADHARHLFASALRQHQAGDLGQAERLYRSVLALEPAHGQSLYLTGIIALQLGRPQEAIKSIGRALAFNEPVAEWHYNLAYAHQSVGGLADAVAHYRRAVTLKPDLTAAQANLARVLLASGETEAALAAAICAFKIEAVPETKQLVVECLSSLREGAVTQDLREIVLQAASEAWGNLATFAHVAAALFNPSIAAMIRRAGEAWPQRLEADALLEPNGIAVLAEDRLFRCLLASTTICSYELEKFFTSLRSVILAWAEHCSPLPAPVGAPSDATMAHAIEVGCSLAQQCFLTGYVYGATDDETLRVRHLQSRLANALEQGTSVPALWPTALATYLPLHKVGGAARLLERAWPDAVGALVQQQVQEPLADAIASIPQLTSMDERSTEVQRQYEESPYPPWARTTPPIRAFGIDSYLRLQFSSAPLRNLGKDQGLDILVAGCGTGQHPILIAQQILGARVLAVDLSRASLAYAQRKTSELGLQQIEYAQADILELGNLGRSFDLIEAVGVLHHLADPQAGWRLLLSLLRSGGVMHIGLYSELARQDVVRARAFIAERGYGATAEDIRRCRQDMFALEESNPLKQVTTRFDFFSLSGCRDLMFNVQEHRMSLPAIKRFLDQNDLQFLGFMLSPAQRRAYAARFPDDPAMIDLDRWHEFEVENPNTFISMYRFGVQKRS